MAGRERRRVNFITRTVTPTPRPSVATHPRSRSSIWTAHLIGLMTLVGLLGLVNRHAIAAAIQVWWVSPTFSHCFLVIPVSAYFVWRDRRALASLTPSAYPVALLLAVPLLFF